MPIFALIALVALAISTTLGVFGTIAFGMKISEDTILFYVADGMRDISVGGRVDLVARCTNDSIPSGTAVIRNDDTLHVFYKCGALEGNDCATQICTSAGICEETVVDGGECYSDSMCTSAYSSLYLCNQTTCQCEQFANAVGYGSAATISLIDASADPIIRFTLGHAQAPIIEGDWLFSGNYIGGVRVGDAFTPGLQLTGVSFASDTFTIIDPGLWRFGFEVQGAKASGIGTARRNWFTAIRRNVSNAIVNQAAVNVTAQGLSTFRENDNIQLTVGSVEYDCDMGDTIKYFFMMSLSAGGSLGDVNVYMAVVWAEKLSPLT